MKARLLVMSMAAAALTMVGCSNDENEMADNWNGEIRLSSGVAVQQTRANSVDVPDTQIAENQEIGIYVSKADAETAEYTGYNNVSAKADGSGNFDTYSTTMYYPQSGKGVKIAAYHPFKDDSAGDEYNFIVEQDQSDEENYYASDLLYSAEKAFDRSKNAHSLTFKHLLCKITCTLTPGDGVSSVEGATVAIVDVEKAVKFNRTTGVVGTAQTSQKGDVKLGQQYGAIIAPQTVAQDAQLLKVTLSAAAGGGVFYYKKADDAAFAGSNLYAYAITVNATGLAVTSTITPWGNNEKNGTAEME